MVHLGNSSPEPIPSTLGNISNSNSSLPYYSSNNHIPTYWHIEFGANDHICSSLLFFDSYYKVKSLSFSISNE